MKLIRLFLVSESSSTGEENFLCRKKTIEEMFTRVQNRFFLDFNKIEMTLSRIEINFSY